jgi:hypothetical protein
MPVEKCDSCGKKLTDQEKERYHKELEDWMRRHPGWMAHIDGREIHSSYHTGIHHDCDTCAVKRLQFEKQIKDRESFFDGVAQGGPEGFWLVAVVILILVAIVMASGR